MSRAKSVDPEKAERMATALELRTQGMTFADIATQLGCEKATVYRWVKNEMDRAPSLPNNSMRNLEERRLDAMWREAWRQMHVDQWVVSHGKVVRNEFTGEPIIDEGAKMAALDRAIRVQERRAKLLGLDAPTRTQTLTMDAVDAEIQRLTAELARNDPLAAEGFEEELENARLK